MPIFDEFEVVSVIVDGKVGYRGVWREIRGSLEGIVSTIMQNRFEDFLERSREGGAQEIQLMRMQGPGKPDTICISVEGKEGAVMPQRRRF
mgnify:CR=1 FL=1